MPMQWERRRSGNLRLRDGSRHFCRSWLQLKKIHCMYCRPELQSPTTISHDISSSSTSVRLCRSSERQRLQFTLSLTLLLQQFVNHPELSRVDQHHLLDVSGLEINRKTSHAHHLPLRLPRLFVFHLLSSLQYLLPQSLTILCRHGDPHPHPSALYREIRRCLKQLDAL